MAGERPGGARDHRAPSGSEGPERCSGSHGRPWDSAERKRWGDCGERGQWAGGTQAGPGPLDTIAWPPQPQWGLDARSWKETRKVQLPFHLWVGAWPRGAQLVKADDYRCHTLRGHSDASHTGVTFSSQNDPRLVSDILLFPPTQAPMAHTHSRMSLLPRRGPLPQHPVPVSL